MVLFLASTRQSFFPLFGQYCFDDSRMVLSTNLASGKGYLNSNVLEFHEIGILRKANSTLLFLGSNVSGIVVIGP